MDSKRCGKFLPNFDELECSLYRYAEDDQFNIKKGECGYCKHPEEYRCVADITRTIPLSHSSIGTFETCHYLYWLQKIRGIEVRPEHLSVALKAGKLWDTLKQKMLGGDVSIVDVINEYQIDEWTVARVRAIYRAYKELEIQVDPGRELQAKIDLEFELDEWELPFQLLYEQILELESGLLAKEINADGVSVELYKPIKARKKLTVYVTGFYDGKYENYFTEDKLSSRPEIYLDPHFLSSQIGTYLLADNKMEKVVMEIVKFPQQKLLKETKNRLTSESPEQFTERIYQDILSRPSNYFIGYNKEKHRYGKVYYKGEFNTEDIKNRYKQVVLEIMMARWTGIFWRNDRACNNILPGISCDFQKLCRSGNMSDEIYRIRGKK